MAGHSEASFQRGMSKGGSRFKSQAYVYTRKYMSLISRSCPHGGQFSIFLRDKLNLADSSPLTLPCRAQWEEVFSSSSCERSISVPPALSAVGGQAGHQPATPRAWLLMLCAWAGPSTHGALQPILLMVGLNDLIGVFQPKKLSDSSDVDHEQEE